MSTLKDYVRHFSPLSRRKIVIQYFFFFGHTLTYNITGFAMNLGVGQVLEAELWGYNMGLRWHGK